MYNQEQYLAQKFLRMLESWGSFTYVYTDDEISEQCLNNVIAMFDSTCVEIKLTNEDGYKEIYGRVIVK